MDNEQRAWEVVTTLFGKQSHGSFPRHREVIAAALDAAESRGLERAAKIRDAAREVTRLFDAEGDDWLHDLAVAVCDLTMALAQPAPRCPCGGDYCTNPACDWPEDKPAPSEPRKHVAVKHEACDVRLCPICDGGLLVCSVCRQAEVDLEDECPGPKEAEGAKGGGGG